MSTLHTRKHELIPRQDVLSVRDLVQEPAARQFAIPFNQRPWVWKESNLQDLWADLLVTLDKFFMWDSSRESFKQRDHPTGNPHYFGAFVFYKQDEETYAVVDGQQRLTSICMLAAVLRELVRGVGDRNADDIKLRAKAEGMVTALTAWLQSNPAAGRRPPAPEA